MQKQTIKMKDNIYIIGAGGHGQVVADALLKMGIKPSGFFDDNLSEGSGPFGIPILGKVSLTKGFNGKFIVAIGNNATRKKIVEMFNFPDGMFYTVIHPSAVIGKGVKIGTGSMIIGGAVINTQLIIGRHVIINTSVSIDHHNIVEDFVHIAPGVHTGGDVKIGEGAFIGIGASIIPGIKIGEWSIIGAGSVIIEDVPDYATVVGVPGKVIKRNNIPK